MMSCSLHRIPELSLPESLPLRFVFPHAPQRPVTLKTEGSPANALTPIMMAHGTMDPLIPVARGKSVYDELTKRGYQLSWSEYPMPHAVCTKEIRDIADWLIRILI